MKYALAYDIGTTGVKTCLFEIGSNIRLIAGESEGYPLYVLPDGGAEQDPDEWWSAMCNTTKAVIKATGVDPKQIDGISFCSQAQGLVLVDKDGKPVRRAMSYMDQRARKELKEGMANGIQIAGANIFKLIPSLIITGAVSSSVKDPIWKYKWIEANEPENLARAYRWLDVKEYMISRCTGRFVIRQEFNRRKRIDRRYKPCKSVQIFHRIVDTGNQRDTKPVRPAALHKNLRVVQNAFVGNSGISAVLGLIHQLDIHDKIIHLMQDTFKCFCI